MSDTQQQTDVSFFTETRPASIRIWHWLVFLFFTATISTVIFGSTLYSTRDNISLVQEQVQQKGGTVTKEQAWSVAHEFSDKLWMLHKYIGFGLSILLLWRIVAEVSISKDQKFTTRIRKALSYPNNTDDKKHALLVEYGYLIFYLLFIIMTLTGLVLAFEDLEFLKPVHRISGNIHSIVQWGLYGYILLHIAGVIRADLTKYSGIVSRMINGK